MSHGPSGGWCNETLLIEATDLKAGHCQKHADINLNRSSQASHARFLQALVCPTERSIS